MSGIQLKNWQKMKIRINTEQAKIKSPGHIVSKSLRMSHLTHLTTLRAKRATFIDKLKISNLRVAKNLQNWSFLVILMG